MLKIQNGKNFRALNVGKNSYAMGIEISSGGAGSDASCICHNVHIGQSTSIGKNVNLIIDINHDYNSVYKGLILEFNDNRPDTDGFRSGGTQIYKRINRKGQILIGNDVWIGNGVTIMGGVRINDGAVVAAEAVVTKDVPPYSIVGGNPSKVIKYCFDKETIEALRRIAWWNWTSDELLERKEDMRGEVSDFVKKYDKPLKLYQRKSGQFVQRIAPNVPLIVYFMDFEDEFPVHTNVLSGFMKKYNAMNAELLLCYDSNNPSDAEKMENIINVLQKYDDIKSIINVCGIVIEDEERIISESDMYITNRDYRTLSRVEIADRYGVEIVSGVDIPLFHN